jgi:ribonuclease E
MELPKNQRDVEDRLRDAMKMDRARIQIGRLSRFGLLEMSRQRLRPSLGDSSNIVCPRCTGIGSIRSVESMALALLRLVGEETRKDRTTRVVVQVPIEVGTYLINEKRDVLRALELKSNIDLTIVPNPYMQTPEYSIRRVRDDESDLPENRQLSYQIPTPPAVVDPVTVGEKKAAQEAPAVVPIMPTTPAPVAAAPAPAAVVVAPAPTPVAPVAPPAAAVALPRPASAAGMGFWERVKFVFGGSSNGAITAVVPAAETAPEVARPRRENEHDGRRDGRRGEHRRPERGADGGPRRDGRGDGRDGEARRDRHDGDRSRGRDGSRDRDRGREPRRDGAFRDRDGQRPRDPQRDGPSFDGAPREAREPREPREPREAREPRDVSRPRGDGPRGDGPRSDGLRSDGPRGDGPRGDGPRGDGPRGDGDGRRPPRPPEGERRDPVAVANAGNGEGSSPDELDAGAPGAPGGLSDRGERRGRRGRRRGRRGGGGQREGQPQGGSTEGNGRFEEEPSQTDAFDADGPNGASRNGEGFVPRDRSPAAGAPAGSDAAPPARATGDSPPPRANDKPFVMWSAAPPAAAPTAPAPALPPVPTPVSTAAPTAHIETPPRIEE